LLAPPLHAVSLQFTFANAGVAALKLVVVAAAIMTAVVINITESLVLVFSIMHGIMMIAFICVYFNFEKEQ
jgi:hypothetical protein